jgi:hypothetical protein
VCCNRLWASSFRNLITLGNSTIQSDKTIFGTQLKKQRFLLNYLRKRTHIKESSTTFLLRKLPCPLIEMSKLGTCRTLEMSLSNPRHQSFCDNCKKNGHLDKDCWSKGGRLEDKSPKQQKKWTQKARRSNPESHYGDEQSETNFTYLAESKQFMWILDGGSTIHICKSRSAFTTFTVRNAAAQDIGLSEMENTHGVVIVEIFWSGGSTIRVIQRIRLYEP